MTGQRSLTTESEDSLRADRRHSPYIPDCRGRPLARQSGMTPSWPVRLNDLLPWLNPLLGLIAGVLAAMVISAAAGRLPVQPSRPDAPVVRVVQQPAPV